MEAAIAVIRLITKLGELVADLIQAEKEGRPLRVEDVLPPELEITLTKRIADAKAKAKYGITGE